MRKLIILLILLISTVAFAQNEIDWWVFDGGGQMVSPATGDTVWVSMGQPIIRCGSTSLDSTVLCAGYLCLWRGACVGIQQPGEGDKDEINKPYVFGINSAAPNPFNPSTFIEFEIEEECIVDFEFFDIMGHRVDAPLNDQKLVPGRYKLKWGNHNLPSGTYFARLSTRNKVSVKRVICVK